LIVINLQIQTSFTIKIIISSNSNLVTVTTSAVSFPAETSSGELSAYFGHLCSEFFRQSVSLAIYVRGTTARSGIQVSSQAILVARSPSYQNCDNSDDRTTIILPKSFLQASFEAVAYRQSPQEYIVKDRYNLAAYSPSIIPAADTASQTTVRTRYQHETIRFGFSLATYLILKLAEPDRSPRQFSVLPTKLAFLSRHALQPLTVLHNLQNTLNFYF
jgi:hypothetical protein